MGARVTSANIKKGTVYVGRGGKAILPDGKVTGWGFDRIKVIKVHPDGSIQVQTPWGTELTLPAGYPLYETTETALRQEFKVVRLFNTRVEMTFDEALASGICQEISSKTTTEKDEKSEEKTVTPPLSKTETMDLYASLVDWFKSPHTISSAVDKFGGSYQNIRNALHSIRNKGYNNVRYELKKGNKSTYTLVRFGGK